MLFYIATVSTFKHVRRQNKPEVCTCRQWGELVYMYMIIFISMMNVFKCLKYYYAFCLFFYSLGLYCTRITRFPSKEKH